MRPSNHLKAAGSIYPNAWGSVDHCRQMRGKTLPNWPGWCFMPVSGWYSIVSLALQKVGKIKGNAIPATYSGDIGRLAAVGTWRYSQGIYRFDPDVFESLWTTKIRGNLPSEVLYRLPEWCVYIETPGHKFCHMNLHGFFAHMEYDVSNEDHELRLLFDLDDYLLPVPIHVGDWTLAEALNRTIEEAKVHIKGYDPEVLDISRRQLEGMAEFLAPMVSLVLYLCSDNPDFGPGKKPFRPLPKKTKKGWRLFPPASPTIWHVGASIGKQIREARQAEATGQQHAGVRPHLRRAHWHGYRVGPRSKPQEFRYHWLPPILVKEFEEKNED